MKQIPLIKIASSMVIFGTIGMFVRYIPLDSSVIALLRGVIGTLFLLIILLVKGKRICFTACKENFVLLFLSGAAMGFNWILLFESYKHTSVAISTLCYYTAPIIVILTAPFLLKEKLSKKNMLCVLAALVGMIFVSGVLQARVPKVNDLKGILFGLCAAVLYAAVMHMNKRIKNMDPYDKTIVQLVISAVTLLPYCYFTVDKSQLQLDATAWIMLLVVGVVHTGFAYVLYFGSMEYLKAQTVAVLSYIDPVIAVAISAIVLKEQIFVGTWIGAALILGAAVISELPSKSISVSRE